VILLCFLNLKLILSRFLFVNFDFLQIVLDLSTLACYIPLMIFTDSQLRYLASLPASVAQALPAAINPDVPFFIPHDPVILNYEFIRSVWFSSSSIDSTCLNAKRSKADFYRLEHAFLAQGIPALFPSMEAPLQQPALERLAIMVKSTRPAATEAFILGLAQALRLEHSPSLRTIGHILHCHGMGNTRNGQDREFWHGIQMCMQSLQSLPAPLRSRSERKKSFYQADELLHVRFELFRELASDPSLKVGDTIRRYGLSRPSFYKYLHRFRLYGPWGLVDWLQSGSGRHKLSEELELRIIEEKLEHPALSLEALVSRLHLRCSRTAVHEILKFWKLLDKDRAPIRVRGMWGQDQDGAKPATPLLRTAKEASEAGLFQVSRKVNAHFATLLESLRTRDIILCDPGPVFLAQFIDDLGMCEALTVYGPKRPNGGECTNVLLLNVCRIMAGYETLNHLQQNGDRSVAIAAGMGIYPGKTALYEGFGDLRFSHLEGLRNDVAARARDLGLIRGERIAMDFHFKEFYGGDSEGEEIGKGPNGAGELRPGFRPHVAWDLDTDVLVNLAFCNGSSRGPRVVREFCEKNLHPILGRETLREIYTDSEYTSTEVLEYFVVDEYTTTDVVMCLKRNRRIDKLAQEVVKTGKWEPYGEQYEIAGQEFTLGRLPRPLHLVVKKNRKTGDLRCFGTTISGLSHQEVLSRYRLRWPIENGLKDLIHSYFIDHILGKEPDKVEANFYCVQVARLAYENFLQSLDENFVRDSAGCKVTLSNFRYLLFSHHNCRLRLRGDKLELTWLDMGEGELQEALKQLLERREAKGLNRVSWWGGLGLTVRFEDQFGSALPPECLKSEGGKPSQEP